MRRSCTGMYRGQEARSPRRHEEAEEAIVAKSFARVKLANAHEAKEISRGHGENVAVSRAVESRHVGVAVTRRRSVLTLGYAGVYPLRWG